MNDQIVDSISVVVQSLVKAYSAKVNADLLRELGQAYEEALREEARCKRMKQRELILELFSLDQTIRDLQYTYDKLKRQTKMDFPEILQEITSLTRYREKIAREKNQIKKKK